MMSTRLDAQRASVFLSMALEVGARAMLKWEGRTCLCRFWWCEHARWGDTSLVMSYMPGQGRHPSPLADPCPSSPGASLCRRHPLAA